MFTYNPIFTLIDILIIKGAPMVQNLQGINTTRKLKKKKNTSEFLKKHCRNAKKHYQYIKNHWQKADFWKKHYRKAKNTTIFIKTLPGFWKKHYQKAKKPYQRLKTQPDSWKTLPKLSPVDPLSFQTYRGYIPCIPCPRGAPAHIEYKKSSFFRALVYEFSN